MSEIKVKTAWLASNRRKPFPKGKTWEQRNLAPKEEKLSFERETARIIVISHIQAKTFFGAKIAENRVNFATKRQKSSFEWDKVRIRDYRKQAKTFFGAKKAENRVI